MNSSLRNYFLKIWHDGADSNNEYVSQCFDTSARSIILDLGCGDGRLITEWVLQKIANPTIWGMDIDRKDLDIAVRKYKLRGVRGNVEKRFPFKDSMFDVVCANQIIEHVVDLDHFVGEINRVLKPQAYAIVATENLSAWHNIVALSLGWQAFSQHISYKENIGNPLRMGNYTGLKKSGMHIKILTLSGLKQLFEIHGFRVTSSFGAGYYPFSGKVARTFSKIDPVHSAFIGIKAIKL